MRRKVVSVVLLSFLLFSFCTQAEKVEPKTEETEEVEKQEEEEEEEETNPLEAEDLVGLPEDTGGTTHLFYRGTTDAKYGYMLYTPSHYEENDLEYPIIVSLHGAGKRGNSQKDADALKKMAWLGPLNAVKKGEWSPSRPFILVAPQTGDKWDPDVLHGFIAYLIETYRINTSRIYLSGNSMGGFGCWNYIAKYGAEAYAAAVVPICGKGDPTKAQQFASTPIWAFHGMNDKVVAMSGSVSMIDAIRELGEEVVHEPKLTLYPNVPHDSWTITYDSSGMGQESSSYDVFDVSIYDWFLGFRKAVD